MKKFILFWSVVVLVAILSTLTILSLFYSTYLTFIVSKDSKEALSPVSMYIFFLRITGTLAFICIGIATTLGALRNVIFSFYKNTHFWKIHTNWSSTLGVGFSVSHFVIYLVYQYKLEVPFSIRSFMPNFIRLRSTNNLLFFALVAMVIFIINLIISNIPDIKEKKVWKAFHIFNFLGFFLVLYHALNIGGNRNDILFQILYVLFFLLAFSGLLHRSFKFASKNKKPQPVQKQLITDTHLAEVEPLKTNLTSDNTSSLENKDNSMVK